MSDNAYDQGRLDLPFDDEITRLEHEPAERDRRDDRHDYDDCAE